MIEKVPHTCISYSRRFCFHDDKQSSVLLNSKYTFSVGWSSPFSHSDAAVTMTLLYSCCHMKYDWIGVFNDLCETNFCLDNSFFTILVHFTNRIIKVEKNYTFSLLVNMFCFQPVGLFSLVFTMVIGTLRNQELQNIFYQKKKLEYHTITAHVGTFLTESKDLKHCIIEKANKWNTT